MSWRRAFGLAASLLSLLALLQILGPGKVPPGDKIERVRAFTRPVEFDYTSWTLDAAGVKFGQIALEAAAYLDAEGQRQVVLDYLDLVRRIQETEGQLSEVFADPAVADPEAASAPLRQELEALKARREALGPLAEAVFQKQLGVVLAELGFTLGGQPVPPVLYHSTPLPWALIVSPRDLIRQDANISLQTDFSVDQQVALEARVDEALDVSSLVVPVGGIGTYPTMVAQTTDLNWQAEVVSHEWMHNYLTLRPLGLKYDATPQLRTMNETAASIAGREIGEALILRFYPEFAPPPPPEPPPASPEVEPAPPPEPPAFDFRAEMRETRLTVDALLAEGKIEQAEAYMEARRLVFWEHGFHIRKLNQAYFAFHGAYADEPGGAAGEDPVGEAVRALRAKSLSLAAFINRIAWMTSFEQLQGAVSGAP